MYNRLSLHFQDTDLQNTLHMEAFMVRPTYFCMLPNDVIDLRIQFNPGYGGLHLVRTMVVCDNNTIKTLDLFGEAYLFDFSWIQFMVSKF